MENAKVGSNRHLRVIGVAALALGLGAGGYGIASAASGSNSTTTTPTATSGSANPSNEDATHEAGESAAREAAEDNGTADFGPGGGGSNEDATHEAGESAAREAEETAQGSGSTSTTDSGQTTTPSQ